jgi:hypothetical protein
MKKRTIIMSGMPGCSMGMNGPTPVLFNFSIAIPGTLNRLRPLLCLIMVLLFSAEAFSQSIAIDRKKKPVFSYYSVDNTLFSLSADGDVAITLMPKFDTARYVLTKASLKKLSLDKTTSVIKLVGYPVEFKLITNLGLAASNKLKDLRPGFQVTAGRQVAVSNIYDSVLPTMAVASGGINIIFKMDNFAYFDTIKKANPSYRLPITYGIEGHHNIIFRNRTAAIRDAKDPSKQYKNRFILSGTASVTNTWNEDDMLSYQELNKVMITPPVVGFETAAGKYGVLQENKLNLRLSLSTPMYFWAKKFWWHFNPVPYVVFSSFEGQKPVYYAGAFINILNERKTAANFNAPSSLGFGIDWKFTDEEIRSKAPVLFLKGTFSFDKKQSKK